MTLHIVFHQVHKVFASGLAAEEGTIQKGDKIVSINGHMLHDVKHAEATAAVRQARTSTVAVVVVDKSCVGKETESGDCRSEERSVEGRPQGAVKILPALWKSSRQKLFLWNIKLFHVHFIQWLYIVTTTGKKKKPHKTQNNNYAFCL